MFLSIISMLFLSDTKGKSLENNIFSSKIANKQRESTSISVQQRETTSKNVQQRETTAKSHQQWTTNIIEPVDKNLSSNGEGYTNNGFDATL